MDHNVTFKAASVRKNKKSYSAVKVTYTPPITDGPFDTPWVVRIYASNRYFPTGKQATSHAKTIIDSVSFDPNHYIKQAQNYFDKDENWNDIE